MHYCFFLGSTRKFPWKRRKLPPLPWKIPWKLWKLPACFVLDENSVEVSSESFRGNNNGNFHGSFRGAVFTSTNVHELLQTTRNFQLSPLLPLASAGSKVRFHGSSFQMGMSAAPMEAVHTSAEASMEGVEASMEASCMEVLRTHAEASMQASRGSPLGSWFHEKFRGCRIYFH